MSFEQRTRKTPDSEASQKLSLKKASRNLTVEEAKRKLMDLVAGRDHTEKELRSKLVRYTDEATAEETIQWAQKQNWLASSEKLKEDWAEKLSRKGKGVKQINQKLQALGLDTIKASAEDELAKARRLALAKWSAEDFKNTDPAEAQKLKIKIMRYLAARGFEAQIINQILKNDFKCSSSEEDIYDEEF